jgi:uncharacterized small protein (DUF1192 family)
MNSKQPQVEANDVIDNLLMQIANLSKEIAILKAQLKANSSNKNVNV